jgi:signal transduction histidine kinase
MSTLHFKILSALVPLGSTLLVYYLTYLFWPVLKGGPFFLEAANAILISLFFGFRLGMLSAFAFVILTNRFLMTNLNFLDFNNPQDLVKLPLFLFVITLSCWISALAGKNREKLRLAIKDLNAEKTLREEFVSMLSHDLQNPISAAKLKLDFLAQFKLEVRHRQDIEGILKDLGRAERLIKDLLDVSRVQTGKTIPIWIERFNLDALITEIFKDLSLSYPAKFFNKSPENLLIEACPSGVRRILENLIINAAKYGDSDQPITVSTFSRKRTVCITVHNFGNPIPQQILPYLFKPFERAPIAIKTRNKGWGLGLPLVKALTEAHGGRAWAKSDVQEGTTFIVMLPKSLPTRNIFAGNTQAV